MSKYQEIKRALTKMLRSRSRSDEVAAIPEVDIDVNESMTEGRKPKVFGINKKLTYFLAGVGIVVFLFGFLSGLLPDSKSKKAEKTVEIAAPVANLHSPINDTIPDGYGDVSKRMAAYEAQQKGTLAVGSTNANRMNANQQPDSYREQDEYQSESIPAIRRSQQRSRYYEDIQGYPNIPGSSAENTAQPGKTETKKNEYGAPIRVSFKGGNSESTDGQGSQDSVKGYSADVSYTAVAPNTLQAGTLIPAVLISGVNSDVGGQAIAQVQSDIYDSVYGSTLLIPAGSRLIGQYNAGAVTGQNRVSISWTNLVLPNGGSYALGKSVVAVDGAGYAGLPGKVNNHSSKVLGGAAATSALAALGSVAAGNTGNSDTYTAGQLATQGAMANLLNTASSMMQKNMNVTPTVTIEPGYPFNVFVGQAISLQPY
ncbi:TrbI/VirB10 family protein [Anaerospora hongkongensis]|uniref:TrbI/VirB10 family protein n=1 Tax=Anaerospora hongkongensis TaxID=244830 RepID=UPI002FDB461A